MDSFKQSLEFVFRLDLATYTFSAPQFMKVERMLLEVGNMTQEAGSLPVVKITVTSLLTPSDLGLFSGWTLLLTYSQHISL